MLDPEAVPLQRRTQRRTPRRVPGPLLRHVRVVAERRDGGRLHGRRHDHAAVLADLQQLPHHHRVARHEGGAVTGQVGTLGERVHGQQPLVRAAADIGAQHRDRLRLPAQLQVALVTDQQHPVLPGPGHGPPQPIGRQHPTGRVGRRVQPEQPNPRGVQLRDVLVLDRFGAAEPGADLVGRVGEPRVGHLVTGAQAELPGQPGHQLLGADGRQHRGRLDLGAAAPPQPVGDRRAQLQRPPDGRVAGGVGRGRQRLLDQLRDRVHRRAHGEVAQPVRVGQRRRLVGLQLVPGEDRQQIGYAARRPG